MTLLAQQSVALLLLFGPNILQSCFDFSLEVGGTIQATMKEIRINCFDLFGSYVDIFCLCNGAKIEIFETLLYYCTHTHKNTHSVPIEPFNFTFGKVGE